VTARFVIATANPDKLAEIHAILADAAINAVLVERPPDAPEVDETGATLEENARLKAVTIARHTGTAALADDTGLEVDALDGAPGVFTSRFAGAHATYADNVAKLLRELRDVEPARRTARFTTVAIARWPDGRELVALGTAEGRIIDEPRGALGFGYDPVFVPLDGDGRTLAEMTRAEKHTLSHRGRAFRALAQLLRAGEPSGG
jgi:XTP/dITP diphosphohydrolase